MKNTGIMLNTLISEIFLNILYVELELLAELQSGMKGIRSLKYGEKITPATNRSLRSSGKPIKNLKHWDIRDY